MKVRCSGCKRYIEKSEIFRRVSVSVFCSQECLDIKSKRAQAKRPKMSESLHDEVVAADGFRCRFCGCSGRLHTHHVIYRSQRGPDVRHNLLSLCEEHHQLVHSNKKRWQRICLGVIWKRDVEREMISVPEFERRYGLQEEQE